MIAKKRTIVVVFHTTAEAMALEKLCKSKGLPGRLFPVPRALTSDCGIAWGCDPSAREALEQAIEEASLDVAGIHELSV